MSAAAPPPRRLAAAPAGRVPDVLVHPPWTVKREPVVVAGLRCADTATMAWEPGERDQWAAGPPRWSQEPVDLDVLAARFTAGNIDGREAPRLFAQAPDDVIAPLLAGWAPDVWLSGDGMRAVVARHELAALPALLAALRKVAYSGAGEALLSIAAPAVAERVAVMLGHTSYNARAWLTRHAGLAARVLVPQALGTTKLPRRRAERALAVAAAIGPAQRGAVLAAAAGYGERAGAAIEALVERHHLEVDDSELPLLPAWVDPASLPQVVLHDGSGALPLDAVRHLCTMLAMTTVEGDYPALAEALAPCERPGLAELGRELLRRWIVARRPKGGEWTLAALAPLADGETVRRLAPQVTSWSSAGGSSFALASLGVEVLARIGTGEALAALQRMVMDDKHKGLQRAAEKRLGQVARARGLTIKELRDRLVPGFGLDPDGGLALDYGSRRFTVGFDEQLRPYVLDQAGKRRTALPRPGAKDDPVLGPAAHRRFTDLVREVRTVTTEQVRRFEHAMVWQERWSGADFQDLVVGHPLLWHLARRLVWAEHRDDSAVRFRIAEDRTFATVDDKPLTLGGTAVVVIAHALDLGPDLAGWRQLFADYELAQPFEQLDRRPATWGDSDPVTLLERVAGRTTSTGHLLGLTRRGWSFGGEEGRGVRREVRLALPGDHTAVVRVDPGVPLLASDSVATQTVEAVRIHHRRAGAPEGVAGLGPVAAFELARELGTVLR